MSSSGDSLEGVHVLSDYETRREAALDEWQERNYARTSNEDIYFEEGYDAGYAEGLRQAREEAWNQGWVVGVDYWYQMEREDDDAETDYGRLTNPYRADKS